MKLLANFPDPAYDALLVYINSIWLGEAPLPIEWKTALVTFIPKAGKTINTDNLRPISLTSCAGKLMEAIWCEIGCPSFWKTKTYSQTPCSGSARTGPRRMSCFN